MRAHYFFFIIYFFLNSFACADELIIEPDMGREPIIKALQQANHSIDLVMYGFTDSTLLNNLLAQQTRSKKLRVILENKPYRAEDENQGTVAQLQARHIAWQGSIPPYRLIHEKTLIIDHRKALVMTFNFTRASFNKERNFALVIDDAKRTSEIADIFSADWKHLPVHSPSAQLLLSPEDSRVKLMNLIANAHHSIQVYAQTLSDYDITGALAKAARKGVTVQLLLSTHLKQKVFAYLTRAGVAVHYSKVLVIHAKVFIIDEEKAVLGSINLTASSLDDNRELSAITQDRHVIQLLLATFNKDWINTP